MALAKERTHYGAFYGENGLLGLEGDHECVNGILRNFSVGHLPHLTDSCSENRVINFKGGSNNSAHCYASLLNFEQGDRASKVRNAVDDSYSWNQINPNRANESRHSEDLNCFEATSSSGYRSGKDNQVVDEEIGWLYSDGGAIDGFEESTVPEANSQKRPHMGNEIEYRKKQRLVEGSRKPKPKTITAKDPQSIAAKNRRERISERLKILQDLVPNGSKVDLVTMLEKAISYVKFLQLQVKVLATDEFWPAQGGKAPEISQVKEAIDAILSSQGDRTTSSN